MIYLIICILFVILAFFDGVYFAPKTSQLIGIFVCIVLILFAGLRFNVGTDWSAYYDFYQYKTTATEPGYGFLNNTLGDYKVPYTFFLLFINSVSLVLVYFALKNNAKFVVIGLLLFYCELYLYFNFSGIRQGVAISFTLFSITYILERKFIKFACCLAVAMSFHITAIIFFIAYFIPAKTLTKKHYIFVILFFLVLATSVYSLTNLLSGDLAYKLQFYLELQEQEQNIKGLFLIGTLKRLIIIFIVVIFGKQLLKTAPTIYFFNVYLFGFGLYLSTYLISPDIGVRLSSYFLIFDIILAGSLIKLNTSLSRRLIIVALLSLVALYKITTYMQLEAYNYKSILNF